MCDRHHSLAAPSSARDAQPEVAALGGGGAEDVEGCGEVRIMTCREFKQSAEALSLWELSRAQNEDEQISSHVQQCESCGGWLSEQRSLAASLGTLRAQTAGLAAGADVERAVLRAFRQHSAQSGALSKASSTAGTSAATDAVPNGVTDSVTPMRPVVTPVSHTPFRANQTRTVSAPLAMRLSRWFEIGAYAAVAAAVIVGMFLGIRLLEHRSTAEPKQAQTSPQASQPSVQKQVVAAEAESPKLAPVVSEKHATRVRPAGTVSPAKRVAVAPQRVATDEGQSDSDAGYTALMFCDPLSCASDSQVVRMELPSPSGQGVQTADLVVGYDGAVRAVRMVN